VTLAWFLENASGFYILLLEEIRSHFSLNEFDTLKIWFLFDVIDMISKMA
jgi:hypothetical protein